MITVERANVTDEERQERLKEMAYFAALIIRDLEEKAAAKAAEEERREEENKITEE